MNNTVPIDNPRCDCGAPLNPDGLCTLAVAAQASGRTVKVSEPYPLPEQSGPGVDGDDDPARPAGCRTLCGGCGQPIEFLTRTRDRARHGGLAGVGGWRHLSPPVQAHSATPWPTWGENNETSSSDERGGA